MPLKPVARRLVPDEVYGQLFDEVVDGHLSPGDALPSERRLSELLGVSRPAVREALQRLSASRLVEVRQGGSSTVRDFRQHAGLDLLPHLLVRNGTLDPAVARSIVDARLAIGPALTRLSARRAPSAPAALRAALREATVAVGATEDPVERQVAALAFWDVVVDLADSLVFRLLFNNLRQAYEPTLEVLAPLLGIEIENQAGYEAVRDAVLAGDESAAVDAATALLRPASELLATLLAELEGASR